MSGNVFTRAWEPAGSPRAVVYLVHGLGEHSGRYETLAERFVGEGFAVSALDLHGHGRSDGQRGATRLATAVGDVDELMAAGEERWPGAPGILYGHSLGALLAVRRLVERPPRSAAGAVISAIGVHSALREQRAKVRAARLLGRVTPAMRVKAGIDPDTLSRDPAVVAAYRNDELVHEYASMGFGVDALDTVDAILAEQHLVAGQRPPPVPLRLIHGSEDALAYVSGAREVAERWGPACELRVYDGLFHELHHEPEQERVFDDVARWIGATLSNRSTTPP